MNNSEEIKIEGKKNSTDNNSSNPEKQKKRKIRSSDKKKTEKRVNPEDFVMMKKPLLHLFSMFR